MILRRSDIAAFVANWDDKARNLETIARRLNIGLDSLVFIDDNPVERARIREALPMVAVPELPDDAAHYVRYLAGAGYFEAISFTAEDRDRAAQYVANVERDAMLESAGSMDDFLRRLDMSVVFGPLTALDLARATQLINKTNQFNPTTRRCTGEELVALSAARENITLAFRLLDRLGDNGLVSVMILQAQPGQPDVLDVACWVMSCRVFGRQLEFEAMNIAVEIAHRRGARLFQADYIPTAKNQVVSGLYAALGFAKVEDAADAAEGTTRWQLPLAEYLSASTHIARKSLT
jgi:FkbH-like protein